MLKVTYPLNLKSKLDRNFPILMQNGFFRAKLLFHGHPWACPWSVRCHWTKRLWKQPRFARKRTMLDIQVTWETHYKRYAEFLIAWPHFSNGMPCGLAIRKKRSCYEKFPSCLEFFSQVRTTNKVLLPFSLCATEGAFCNKFWKNCQRATVGRNQGAGGHWLFFWNVW